MTTEERERMNWLCQRIVDEKDPHIFTTLADELNDLLERKEKRLNATKPDSSKSGVE
jgi:hypothetical protein